jgi:tetratricopeptide (TPR) repeat protein
MESAIPKIESILAAAVEILVEEERRDFVERACAGDVDLKRRVERMIEDHFQAGSFLECPARPDATMDQPIPEGQGAVIGAYKLIEQIGEGGMGVVWMAQQTEPVKRLVAIKLIKAGMDSKQIVARFEAERQALALMDHPNIAKVLDGGTTASGRPFFVMDLVKGVPITRYCDEHHLTPRQRLELFVPVCHAIQHAHQKGVIHRDLKPSNVLIAQYDGRPVPRVIDFGVAKAAGQSLTDKTLVTGFGSLVGTLEYMSPEQAEVNQLDIDTRSDIYSLGVLLYELLTGSPPFSRKELEKAGLLEMLRVIREQEPSKPSTKLSTAEGLPTLAANRGTEPAKLTKLVRGELDWIVMKALEKDRNRRYETANGFAMDVQRYLADEAVQACPPSASYRLRKFARRNRRILATGAVLGVTVLIAVGAVAGVVGWEARDRAERQNTLDQHISRALDEVASAYKRGDLTEARAAALRAEGLLASGTSGEELQQRTRQWLTDVQMVAELDRIRLERAAGRKDGSFDRPRAKRGYRAAFARYGLDLESLEHDEAARRIKTSAIADRLIATLDDWALVSPGQNFTVAKKLLELANAADNDAWRRRLRDALIRNDFKAVEALARAEDTFTQSPGTLELLADVLEETGHLPLAVEILRQAQRRHVGDLWINHNLGMKLRELKQVKSGEAAGFLRVAVAVRPDSAVLRNQLAVVLEEQGLAAEAEFLFRAALRSEPDYAMARSNLGSLLIEQDRLEEAEQECRHAVRTDPTLALARNSLAIVLWTSGQLTEAESASREAIRLDPDFVGARATLGVALHGLGKTDEAEAEYREAIRRRKDYALPHSNLGALFWERGKLDEAEAACREAIRLDAELPEAHCNLGNILKDRGQFEAAIAEYRLSLRLKPRNAIVHSGLGSLFAQQRKFAEAEVEYRAAIKLNPRLAECHDGLGAVLVERGALDEGEAEFREALRLNPKQWKARYNLGVVAEMRQKPELAEPEYREALRINPDYRNARYQLAAILYGRGDLPAAKNEFRELTRRVPDFAQGHIALGAIHASQNEWTEAAASFDRAVRLAPNALDPHVRLAWVLTNCPDLTVRNPTRALEVAGQAVKIDANSYVAWRALGWAEFRSGNWKGSIESLEKSTTLQPNPKGGDPGQWFFLAMAYSKLENHEEAARWYGQAIQWMEKHQPNHQEWKRFRVEAAELLKAQKPDSKSK